MSDSSELRIAVDKKPVDKRAYKALERVVAANEAMRAAEAERSHQARPGPHRLSRRAPGG